MISYIIGTVTAVSEGFIILENNGIGYKIIMPGSSLYRMSSADDSIKVFTYMAVREDDVSLYGFLTRAELEMFKLLITVSGVGPKGAIGILSSISVDELKMAISAEDSKLIAGAKGVGGKTAQKIVVELKGKVEKNDAFAGGSSQPVSSPEIASDKSIVSEALAVLEALGFGRSESVRAINQIEITPEMTSSELVGSALKIID